MCWPGVTSLLTRIGATEMSAGRVLHLAVVSTALGSAAVIFLIAANAFFVAVEFALVAVDRARVALDEAEGTKPWPLIGGLLRRLSFHLSGAQLGITITSLLLGYVAKPVVAKLLEPLLVDLFGTGVNEAVSIGVALALSTVVQMVLGELIPKTYAIAEPRVILRKLGPAAHWYGVVAGPLIGFLDGMANWITRRLGVEPQEELHSIQSLGELEQVIRSSGKEGTLDPHDVAILTRSIRFADKTAADALVPRVELVAIGVEETVADLAAKSVETGYSRFLVMGNDLDDVRGVVHVKRVHGVTPGERSSTLVSHVMTEVFVVPETRGLESILSEMRASRHQLAVVADEHGGTAGIVTLEDIVEEIVGDISDEHDPLGDTPVVQELGSFVVAGSLHPDEVEEACGFVIPEGNYETIAGFALDQLQRIPVSGELFEFDGHAIEIVEMDRFRISSLRISPLPQHQPVEEVLP